MAEVQGNSPNWLALVQQILLREYSETVVPDDIETLDNFDKMCFNDMLCQSRNAAAFSS